jgi:hypothetical protein
MTGEKKGDHYTGDHMDRFDLIEVTTWTGLT